MANWTKVSKLWPWPRRDPSGSARIRRAPSSARPRTPPPSKRYFSCRRSPREGPRADMSRNRGRLITPFAEHLARVVQDRLAVLDLGLLTLADRHLRLLRRAMDMKTRNTDSK